MNFTEGVAKMKMLADKLKAGNKSTESFQTGTLTVIYPGYKKYGDYRLTENGVAPKHADIVMEIYNQATPDNIDEIGIFLDDVYAKGLYATASIFSETFKEKIFWITLQEEINYPPPQFAGRKLSFQRFYEAALAKTGITDLPTILGRTNNHGLKRPVLFKIEKHRTPSFYQ